ncbi:MAG: RCC1-like domain-containing protein [Evtepia gabavorous]
MANADIGDWTDIVAVAAGDSHTVGLRTDGTVIAAGRDSSGKCALGNWKNIIAVAAGSGSHVGPVSGRHRFGCGERRFWFLRG